MKSKLIKSADLKSLPLPDLTIEIAKEDLEGEVENHLTNERLSKRYYVSTDTVENESIVELAPAEVSAAGHSFLVAVGLGLYDVGEEKKILGKRLGDTVSLGRQDFEILSIRNYTVPEPDDAFAMGLEEYKEYLRTYYLDFYKDGYALYFAMEFFGSWVENSEFYIDPEEKEECYVKYHALMKRYMDAHDSYMDGTAEEIEAFEREEFDTYFYEALFLKLDEMCFDSQSSLEAVMMKALKPFQDFLADGVTFVWTEEA